MLHSQPGFQHGLQYQHESLWKVTKDKIKAIGHKYLPANSKFAYNDSCKNVPFSYNPFRFVGTFSIDAWIRTNDNLDKLQNNYKTLFDFGIFNLTCFNWVYSDHIPHNWPFALWLLWILCPMPLTVPALCFINDMVILIVDYLNHKPGQILYIKHENEIKHYRRRETFIY